MVDESSVVIRGVTLTNLPCNAFNKSAHFFHHIRSCFVTVKRRVVEPEIKFQALALTSERVLAPALAPEWFGALKTANSSLICTTRLPHELGLWNRNPNFWLRLHHLKVFGCSFSHAKLLGVQLHSPGSVLDASARACACTRSLALVPLTRNLRLFHPASVIVRNDAILPEGNAIKPLWTAKTRTTSRRPPRAPTCLSRWGVTSNVVWNRCVATVSLSQIPAGYRQSGAWRGRVASSNGTF